MEFLQDAHTWEAAGLVIFVGVLIYLKVPGMALAALDDRAAKISAQLDEATRLREEAERLLADIKVQREAAEHHAVEIVALAQEEAAHLAEDSKAKLEDQIKRRGEMAERRIALAETQAATEVKAAAADLAAQAAEAVLAARLAAAKSDPLVDAAVALIPSKLQ
jgi:F-type H+-transporting ATPase subunit b